MAVSTPLGNAAGSSKQPEDNTPAGGPSPNLTEGRRFIPPPVDGSRVVRKPIPKAQTEDPREFQIRQLKRRFSPVEKSEDGGSSYAFSVCILEVPVSFEPDIESRDMFLEF